MDEQGPGARGFKGHEATKNPPTKDVTSLQDRDQDQEFIASVGEKSRKDSEIGVKTTSFYQQDSDNESLNDFDMFSKDKSMARVGNLTAQENWDLRFHRIFALLLHCMSRTVSYFSFKFVLNPTNIRHEYFVHFVNPFTRYGCVAPIFRFSLFLVSTIGIIANVSFVWYASEAYTHGGADTSNAKNHWVIKAENAYAVCYSFWAIQYFGVGLFFFSRPKKKDKRKYAMYSLLFY